MAHLLVPDKVYLVCSEGLQMRQLKVTSQSTVYMSGHRLVATKEDKMDGDFRCSKTVVAGAIFGAIVGSILAVTCVLAGVLTMGIGTALIVAGSTGIFAGIGLLGSCIFGQCPYVAKKWLPIHPTAKIGQLNLLLDNSVINCSVGGVVEICYTVELARAKQDLSRSLTVTSVLSLMAMATTMFSAIGGVISTGCVFFETATSYGAAAFGKLFFNVLAGAVANKAAGSLYNCFLENVTYDGNSLESYLDGKAFDQQISDSSFDAYMRRARSPLGDYWLSQAAGAKNLKSDGVYNRYTVERYKYNPVDFYVGPNGEITPNDQRWDRNKSADTSHDNIKDGYVNKKKVVSKERFVRKDKEKGVKSVGKTETGTVRRLAPVGESAKKHSAKVFKGIIKKMVIDIARAAGNILLAQQLQAVVDAQEKENELKNKMMVYEKSV